MVLVHRGSVFQNIERLLAVNYFCKTLHLRLGSEYVSAGTNSSAFAAYTSVLRRRKKQKTFLQNVKTSAAELFEIEDERARVSNLS